MSVQIAFVFKRELCLCLELEAVLTGLTIFSFKILSTIFKYQF